MSSTITSEPIIAVSDLYLTLDSMAGPVSILRGIDLSVLQGDSLSIIGPSGSGKSSLMMVIGGLEVATKGSVEVAGQNYANQSEDALALFRRDHIGIVFQAFHLVPTMTALENVAIPLELAGRVDAFERAGICLESVGLSHRLQHFPSQLSGGEQQRVALARAFAPQPRLLLADEPTGNLDRDTGAKVIDLMFHLRAQIGATLVLITHDPAVAARCDRIVRLENGLIAPE